MLDAAPDGLVMVDVDGRILLANRRAEEVFGYARGELDQAIVEDLLPVAARGGHGQQRNGYLEAPAVRPMGVRQQLWGLRKSGGTFPIEISLSPFALDGRTVVIAAVRDVTERLTEQRILAEAHDAVAVSEDRERIARDLHDTVIQRLFAAGMSLQGIMAQIGDDQVRERAEAVVDQLDETIREIRTTIFSLHLSGKRMVGLRGQLLDLTAELEEALGFQPEVRFDGAVEAVDPVIAEQLLPTLREALSNVARHAEATTVRVMVEAGVDVVLLVMDDGVGGAGDRPGGKGLSNMAERAQGLGGECTVRSRPDGGTEVVWRVPAT
jgi:two-component system sensor histidine kinase DevS